MRTTHPGRSGQGGQILPIFCLLLTLLLLPVAALAVDGGVLLSSQASLVGAVQSAAESGAQVVDIEALEQAGTFQLCDAPPGGSTCNNGVGSVSRVVSETMTAAVPGSSGACLEVTSVADSLLPKTPAGCALALLPGCPGSGAAGEPPEGVEVVGWRTVEVPLLVFPNWTRIVLRARSTAFLEHGFATPAGAVGEGGGGC